MSLVHFTLQLADSVQISILASHCDAILLSANRHVVATLPTTGRVVARL